MYELTQLTQLTVHSLQCTASTGYYIVLVYSYTCIHIIIVEMYSFQYIY